MTEGKTRDTFGLKDPDEWNAPAETEEMVVVNSTASTSTPEAPSCGYVGPCVLTCLSVCPYA